MIKLIDKAAQLKAANEARGQLPIPGLEVDLLATLDDMQAVGGTFLCEMDEHEAVKRLMTLNALTGQVQRWIYGAADRLDALTAEMVFGRFKGRKAPPEMVERIRQIVEEYESEQ